MKSILVRTGAVIFTPTPQAGAAAKVIFAVRKEGEE